MIRWMILFLWVFGYSPLLREAENSELIVWNVGQGQWVTWIHKEHCLHFDMGGEKAPRKKIQKLCGSKKNFAFFSHWDKDHVGFALQAKKRYLPQLCVVLPPRGKNPSSLREKQKRAYWKRKIPPCLKTLSASTLSSSMEEGRQVVQEIPFQPRLFSSLASLLKSDNGYSRVFYLSLSPKRGLLLPGDSTQREEKHWVRLLSPSQRQKTTLLLTGHHGSASSTSSLLLKHLPQLRGAIASARYARYGHPHWKTHQRLLQRGVPLVSTEHWGNLRFRLPFLFSFLKSQTKPY